MSVDNVAGSNCSAFKLGIDDGAEVNGVGFTFLLPGGRPLGRDNPGMNVDVVDVDVVVIAVGIVVIPDTGFVTGIFEFEMQLDIEFEFEFVRKLLALSRLRGIPAIPPSSKESRFSPPICLSRFFLAFISCKHSFTAKSM